MTFYGFNESAQCGWSNVMWQELRSGPNDQPFKKNLTVALQELVSYRQRCNGTGFIMLPVAFFADHGQLPQDWEAALTAFEDTIEPYVNNKSCIGIFMGDEKLCGGVPLTNYTAVLSRLRHRYPHLLLYGNECSSTVGKLGTIPEDLGE